MRLSNAIPLLLTALFSSGSAIRWQPKHAEASSVQAGQPAQPVWTQTTRWKIGTGCVEPTKPFTPMECGPPAIELGEQEAVFKLEGAYRLTDGRIVVAEQSGRQGRDGQGPGEYRELSRVYQGGRDSIYVWDVVNARATLLDRGRFAGHRRTANVPELGVVRIQGVFGDGSFVVSRITGGLPTGRGFTRRILDLSRLTPGEASLPLATFPEMERFFFDAPGNMYAMASLPFHTAYWTARGDYLYWGVTDSFQINATNKAGRVVKVFRRPTPQVTVTTKEIEHQIDDYMGPMRPDQVAAVKKLYEQLPRTPRRAPAFGWIARGPGGGSKPAILVDDDGNVWVVEYGSPARSWTVFRADGAWLGSVAMSNNFALTHIGSDFILGIWKTSETESVRMYKITKP